MSPQRFIPGDVVYFKEAKRTSRRNSDGFRAGHGRAFGLLLGIVPPGTPEPDQDMIFRICANFGMVTVDSIVELMGEEFAHVFVAKLHAKYAAPPAEKAAPSGLLGADGLPVP